MLFVPDPAVEAEISRLEELPLNRPRILWRERLGAVPNSRVPTSCVGAWRTSCRSARMAAWDQMFADALANFIMRSRPTQTTPPQTSQRLKPGTILTREWKGITHQVSILEDGFEYSGEHYQSLPEISQGIVGTKWSGPAFFGLRRSRR